MHDLPSWSFQAAKARAQGRGGHVAEPPVGGFLPPNAYGRRSSQRQSSGFRISSRIHRRSLRLAHIAGRPIALPRHRQKGHRRRGCVHSVPPGRERGTVHSVLLQGHNTKVRSSYECTIEGVANAWPPTLRDRIQSAIIKLEIKYNVNQQISEGNAMFPFSQRDTTVVEQN